MKITELSLGERSSYFRRYLLEFPASSSALDRTGREALDDLVLEDHYQDH
jgi:hypothetical protein